MTPILPLFVESDAVKALLSPATTLRIIEDTLAAVGSGSAINGSKGTVQLADGAGQRTFHAMTGALPELNLVGMKWVGTISANPDRGLPRTPATVLLLDSDTGMLKAVMDAAALTALRTAAVAVVAAKHCAAPTARRAAILGFGAIGQAVATMLSAALGVDAIAVWARDADETAERLSALGSSVPPDMIVAETPKAAAIDADIVICATGLTRDSPLLDRKDIDPSTFVCSLGSFAELSESLVVGARRLVVDDWDGCSKRGTLAPIIRAGVLDQSDLTATLPEIISGATDVRADDGECVVACFTGLGVLDLALAHAVYARRNEQKMKWADGSS